MQNTIDGSGIGIDIANPGTGAGVSVTIGIVDISNARYFYYSQAVSTGVNFNPIEPYYETFSSNDVYFQDPDNFAGLSNEQNIQIGIGKEISRPAFAAPGDPALIKTVYGLDADISAGVAYTWLFELGDLLGPTLPVGTIASARLPGVSGAIPVGSETNMLDVFSELQSMVQDAVPEVNISQITGIPVYDPTSRLEAQRDFWTRILERAELEQRITGQPVPQGVVDALNDSNASLIAEFGTPFCFSTDTPVQMADGTSLPIDQISAGDKILAFDESGELRSASVVRIFANNVAEVIELSNGTQVTPGHRFLTQHGDYCAIEEMVAAGEPVVMADGSLQQVHIERRISAADIAPAFDGNLALKPVSSGIPVYNFEVAA